MKYPLFVISQRRVLKISPFCDFAVRDDSTKIYPFFAKFRTLMVTTFYVELGDREKLLVPSYESLLYLVYWLARVCLELSEVSLNVKHEENCQIIPPFEGNISKVVTTPS